MFDAVPARDRQRLPDKFLPTAVEGRKLPRAARVDDMLGREAAAAREQQMIGRDMLRAVGNDARYLRSRLDKLLNFIESLYLAEIVDHEMAIERY